VLEQTFVERMAYVWERAGSDMEVADAADASGHGTAELQAAAEYTEAAGASFAGLWDFERTVGVALYVSERHC